MTAIVQDSDVSAARAATIWAEMLPDTPMPDEGEFYRWLDRAGNQAATLFRAINRASKKQKTESKAGREMTREEIGRYVTSIVMKEMEGTGKRTFPPNKNLNRAGIRRL